MVFATFHDSPQLGYSFCTSQGSKDEKLHVMIYRDFFRIHSEKLLHKILRSWFMIDCWKMIGPSGKMNDCHNFCETVIFIRSMQPATDLYQLIFFGSTNDWSVVVLNSTKGQQPSSSMPHLLQRWSYPLRLRRKLPETTAGFTLINLTPPERYLVGSSEIN